MSINKKYIHKAEALWKEHWSKNMVITNSHNPPPLSPHKRSGIAMSWISQESATKYDNEDKNTFNTEQRSAFPWL